MRDQLVTMNTATRKVLGSDVLSDIFWLIAHEEVSGSRKNFNNGIAEIYSGKGTPYATGRLPNPKVIAQHLAVLRTSELIRRSEKRGRLQFYELNYARIAEVLLDSTNEFLGDKTEPFLLSEVVGETIYGFKRQILPKGLLTKAKSVLIDVHLPAIFAEMVSDQFWHDWRANSPPPRRYHLRKFLKGIISFFMEDLPHSITLMNYDEKSAIMKDPLISAICLWRAALDEDFLEGIQEYSATGVVIKNLLKTQGVKSK